MKLFHTSDWHLGRMLYGRSLLQDQQWFLEQVFLPAVERERPACVLIAGDIYDRQIAPTEGHPPVRRHPFPPDVAGNEGLRHLRQPRRRRPHGPAEAGFKPQRRLLATELSDALAPVLLEEGESGCSCSSSPISTRPRPGNFWGTALCGERAPAWNGCWNSFFPCLTQRRAMCCSPTALPPAPKPPIRKAPCLWAAAARCPPPFSTPSITPPWGTCTALSRRGKRPVLRLAPQILRGRGAPAEGVYPIGMGRGKNVPRVRPLLSPAGRAPGKGRV